MKILDTKKAKKQHEAEKELHEYEEWLKNGVSSTASPNYDDLKGLWDGLYEHQSVRDPWKETGTSRPIAGKATMDPEKVQKMVNDLRKQFGLNP